MTTIEDKKRIEKEFIEYFSFGKYLDLHQRVEYMEAELDKHRIVKRRQTAYMLRNHRDIEVEEDDEMPIIEG